MSESSHIDIQIIAPSISENSVDIASFIDNPDLKISAIHSNEIQALNHSEKVQPGVILLDYQVRESKTPEYIKLLVKACPVSKIIFIAESLTDDQVIDCLFAGAQGYLENSQLGVFVNKAIVVVYAGEAWVTRQMVGKLLDRIRLS